MSTLSRLALTGVLTVERHGDDIRVTNRNLLKYRDEYSRKSGHSQDKVAPEENRTEKEEEKRKITQIPPVVPPPSELAIVPQTPISHSEEFLPDPVQVARKVIETQRLAGRWLVATIEQVCRAEINGGYDPFKLADDMIAAHERWKKAAIFGGRDVEKFFGQGTWKNPETWNYKDGYAPPKQVKRYYVASEAQL